MLVVVAEETKAARPGFMHAENAATDPLRPGTTRDEARHPVMIPRIIRAPQPTPDGLPIVKLTVLGRYNKLVLERMRRKYCGGLVAKYADRLSED
jgi:hypothetical protein